MTYGTLYIEDGNFLGFYERREDAEADVLEVLEHDRALADEYGYFTFDESGQGRRVRHRRPGAHQAQRRRIAAPLHRWWQGLHHPVQRANPDRRG
jgi:hypothetical protein